MSNGAESRRCDLIVVGSGLAGLYGALLAAEYGEVVVLTKGSIEDANTTHAQGGIAAAMAPPDNPELHYQDTLVAGDGLCDPRAVEVLVEEGPRRVVELIRLGVPFDRVNGEVALGREAAHSQPRILHAGGDATGSRIERTLSETVQTHQRITIRENCDVFELIVEEGSAGRRIAGVRAAEAATGTVVTYRADAVLLASGGAGQLYSQTTNPAVTTGDGIAVAFRAGVEVADLEFVQFHPTALSMPGAPRFLISEAVRGDGGIMRNRKGERFMPGYDARAELAPRDVVARAIAFEMERDGEPCVFLDVRHLGAEHFRERFPTISRVCGEFGIDIGTDMIPIAPATHYLMGGVLTDVWGQTSLPGLYACGECACSGVHGANRLASNSLLEAAVFSARAVRHHFALTGTPAAAPPAASDAELLPSYHRTVKLPGAANGDSFDVSQLRELNWSLAGLSRTGDGLARLSALTGGWLAGYRPTLARPDLERANMVLLSHLIAISALAREESRGSHYRTDFPMKSPGWRRHDVLSVPEPCSLNFRKTIARTAPPTGAARSVAES
ncbi:MAG TPA: L-aspartate oxidase [Chloroflexota bacterium]|nr:L-aspartate oxidase [Chloroflexota bacterium]